MSWQKVDPQEALVKGATYRSTYFLKFPYSDTVADLLRRAANTVAPILRARGQRIIGITTYRPDQTEQTAGGRYTRWRIVLTWENV
jgi:hypothetical protein